MKKFNKIMAVVAAMAMTAAMSFGSFAAVDKTITVKNANDGQTYTLYKIFDATTSAERDTAKDTDENSSVTTKGINYTVPDQKDLTTEYTYTKADGTTSTVKGTDWFGTDAAGNVTANDDADVATEAFREWAKQFGTEVQSVKFEASETSKDVVFKSLEDGYYFITTTTGSLITVDSVAPNAIVKDKNGVPTVEKKVQEDSLSTDTKASTKGDGTTGYQKKNDADLGQRVDYKTVITAQPGAENYVLHDTMTGLTFDAVDSIKAGNTVLKEGTDYTVASKNLTDSCDFEVTFAKSFLDKITEATDITVLYHATVDQDAVIGSEGNPNETWLDYGNGNHTTHRGTKTYVWEVDVKKYTKKTVDGKEVEELLAGAEFKLSRDEKGENVLHFDAKTVEGKTNVFSYNEKGEVTSFTTDNNGYLYFEGLDEGTYYLTEVKAPDGYNKLTSPIKVVITSSQDNDATDNVENPKATKTSTVKYNADAKYAQEKDVTAEGGLVAVINNAGSALPTTGGMGTTILYVAGAILVIAGAAVLVIKKRHEA